MIISCVTQCPLTVSCYNWRTIIQIEESQKLLVATPQKELLTFNLLEMCYSVTDEWTTDGEPSPAKGELVMGMSRVILHQAINHLLYSSATEKTSMR